MPPTLTHDHLETCLANEQEVDNSNEFNLHVTLKKRSHTGVAEKDRKEISFFGEVSQASRASQFKQARQAKNGRI